LITNDRYGLGEFIAPSQVDKYSFYDAAVYNDAGIQYTSGGVYVSGGISDGSTGFEPRFTFNAVVSERQEAFRLLQMVAGAMRSTLVYFNGLITVIQDRPASPVKLITKANVIDGIFDYKSTGLFERHTAINVTYNDRTDRHLQHVTTVDASTVTGAMATSLAAAQTKYGYNPTDVAAYGATTESQAIRQGRWALDTELNQTEMASWKMSLNGFDLMPGDIVKVYDEDYAATVGAGRIVSASGTSVVLDRAVTLTSGSTIEVLLADGVTLESKGITQTSGTLSTVTVASGFSQTVLAGADYIVTTTTAPRQFKIISVKQDDASTITLETLLHDPNKYSRVETGLSLPTPVFSNALHTMTSLPTDLAFRESSVNIDNTIKRSLLISWGQPATGIAAYYSVAYRCNTSTWTTITNHNAMSYELVNIQAGTYDVKVFAHSAYGNQSAAAAGTYTINAANGGTSTLNAPTTLVEQNGGGTAFVGYDLNFKWTNPASNATVLTADLRDFEVRIIETTGSTTVRTYYVASVAAGSVQSSSYTYAMNLADSSNVPRRNIKVEVRCRDSNGNLSAAVQTTFGNAAPSLPSGIAFTGALQSVKLTFNTPTDIDFAGVLVWGSTTNGFTPSSGNLLYDGKSNYVAFNALADATAYYYKVATYDTFGKDYSGTGLTVSTQYSATTSAAPGVNKGATNPGSGTEGDVFFNTTDGQLYRYHSGAWTVAIPAVNVTGTLTDSQLAAIGAAKVTGQIVGTQITDGAISTAKLAAGSVTANEIAADTITASQIAANAITATELSAGAVTTTKLAAGAVTANEIAANTITAAKIAAATITTSEIAASTITGGNLNSITVGASKSITVGTATVSGSTMSGSGAILKGDGTAGIGNGSSSIVFNGSAIVVTGPVIASSNISAAVGGGNLLGVGSMTNASTDTYPGGWMIGTGMSGSITKYTTGGAFGNGYIAMGFGYPSGGTNYLKTSNTNTNGAIGGVRGGFQAGRKYIISYYSSGMGLSVTETIQSPAFSTAAVSIVTTGGTWYRCVAYVTCTTTTASGEFSIVGVSSTYTGVWPVSNVKVEEGTLLTSYSETQFGPMDGTNISSYMNNGAITEVTPSTASDYSYSVGPGGGTYGTGTSFTAYSNTVPIGQTWQVIVQAWASVDFTFVSPGVGPSSFDLTLNINSTSTVLDSRRIYYYLPTGVNTTYSDTGRVIYLQASATFTSGQSVPVGFGIGFSGSLSTGASATIASKSPKMLVTILKK
jgi:predicted phage tail protein